MGTHPIFESDFDCLTEMADIFGSLEKDSKIKIKRSNGVVHQATVTSLVPGNLTVNVEWFENEDIKGKELSVEQVFHLNPEYRPAHGKVDRRTVREVSSQSAMASRKSVLIPTAQSLLKKENKIPSVHSSSASKISVSSRRDNNFAEPAPPRASRKSEVVRNVEKIDSDRRDRRENQK